MRLRKLAMAIGASAVILSGQSFALGLGEIRLNSALNQPLDAQIKLLQVRDLSEEEIIVRLASREAFENANVERLFFLTGLKFEVVLDDPANPHVRVTSQENVREPYLNFLIESQWPTGRMLREYTVLMDLPTFSEKNQKVVSAPSQQAAPEAARPAPAVKPRPAVKAAEPAPAARPERQYAPSQAGGTYAVGAGDTLWEIALQARPDRSYSVQQTMLAIQRLNPDAFINNNINLLKKGQVLRLPDADEIASLNTRQAINEVAYQNNQWGGGAALEASRRSGAVAEDGSVREGRVQLSAGGASQQASSGLSSGRSQALQNELAIAQEQLDAAQRENSELTARVSDLEDQIATMERLIQVTNQELRALQLAAGQTPETSQDLAEEEQAAQVPDQPQAVQQPEQPQPQPSTVVRQAPQPEPGIVDLILDNILYLALGLVAILGGLLFWKRRSEQVTEEDEDIFAEEPSDSSSAEDDYEQDMAFDEELEAGEEVDEAEDYEAAEAETADVAGEADIYIAYGKYDQAEDMLLKALAREPGRADVTLKLLEVYAETKNLEQFDQHFAGLLASGDAASRQRAEELRESIPGAGEFDRTQVQSLASAEPDEDMDALMDLDLDEPAETQSFDRLEGLDEDFGLAEEGLSLDLDETGQEPAEELDFTLDDLDAEAPAAEDFALDLDSETSDGEALGAADEEFTLDLDDSGESADDDFALELDSELAGSDADQEDFSLDLGDLETAATDEAEDFSLELGDLDEQEPAESEDEFSLSLDDEGDAVATGADDFELSLDEESPVEQAEEAFDLSLDDELSLDKAAADTLSVEADDFDSEDNLGDMDLAALDEEMESLSADLDLDSDLSSLDLDAEAGEAEIAEEEPEFDISADLGIEEGADELPPLDEQTVFDEAMAGQAADEEDEDAELGFLADSDEVATKLDLARAYIDMGDSEGARDILSEVMEEGDAKQKGEAEELLGRIG